MAVLQVSSELRDLVELYIIENIVEQSTYYFVMSSELRDLLQPSPMEFIPWPESGRQYARQMANVVVTVTEVGSFTVKLGGMKPPLVNLT